MDVKGEGLVCLLGLVAAATGCATTAPMVPAAPAVAFSASRSDVDAGCSLEGMPRVVATRLRPMAGVAAAISDGHVWLRFTTTRDPRVQLAVDPETLEVVVDAAPLIEVAPTAKRGQVEVNLRGHRHLVARTEGSLDDGLHVKAVAVGEEDTAVSTSSALGFEGSAIGDPAIAFGHDGKGVLAFIESNEVGFQLVVTRVACDVP